MPLLRMSSLDFMMDSAMLEQAIAEASACRSRTQVSLTSAIFTEVFELENGNDSMELSNEEYDAMLDRMGHSSENASKLLKVDLAIEFRLLADVVGKVICAKRTAHDAISRHQFCIMAALLDKKHLNWGEILFDLVKKKVNKTYVHFGRVLGLLLHHICPQLLVSSKHINASKRLTCALIGKWDRKITNPRAAAAMKTSTETRTVVVTSPQPSDLVEEAMPSITISSSFSFPTTFTPSTSQFSSPMPTTSSIATIASSIPPSITTSEDFHPLHFFPPMDIEINNPDDSFLDGSPDDTSETPSLSDLIMSSIIEPTIPIPSIPTSSPVASVSPPSTSAQHPLEQVDLLPLANKLYELLDPRLSSLLDASLAPIILSLNSISSKLSSLTPFVAGPSSRGLESGFQAPTNSVAVEIASSTKTVLLLLQTLNTAPPTLELLTGSDRRSTAGWGTNEELIVTILAHRFVGQRRQIRQAYADLFGEDILKSLDKELRHDFENLMHLWVLDLVERDAVLAHESAKRWGP
ncbi:Annexin D1 [Platanthera zijinensis]|uniref:Annexin D1 n=1 Tax=Platanthera zijinensis TaxID=2320716 RepID=A0AAP0B1C9_9ASPA